MSLQVTRQKLVLGDRDATTGWYSKDYTETTKEMIVIAKGSTTSALPSGVYVRTDALGLTTDGFNEGDKIQKGNVTYEVKATREHVIGESFWFRECDLTLLQFESLSGAVYVESTVEDAKYRTKVYLETYLSSPAMPNYIVAYGEPDYPITQVFKTKNVDLAFCIGDPNSEPIIDSTHYIVGYKENVPITPCCIDKDNITGAKLLQQARTELRRITETYPLGSLRLPAGEKPQSQLLGSTTLYKFTCYLDYERDKT